MKADHLTFRRAASVALIGLGLQLLMGLVLLVYSIILNDRSALAGSMMILTGSIVWTFLAVVFDQHRRERIEALEAESFIQASARETSVFGERADDLRVAARRLAWMHKWLLPIASLLFATVLAALGVWLLYHGQDILSKDSFRSLDQSAAGWAISIGLALAFVGFVFARYVSGMAKQPVWANLRAGAAQSVGAALIGLVIVIAQFVDYAGPDVIARYLLVGIPVFMLAIAGETVLNFLLALYRPRRPGEIPRPAFESRILGFVAAPDRIAESIGGALNYQFGFDVTGSWFYQLLSRSLTVLALIGLLVIWGLTCVGVVQPNEQGLRIRFGDRRGGTLGPGPYLKLPWPLERIERFDAATVRRLDLGGEQPKVKGSILWTNDHGVAETYFAVRPSAADVTAGVELQRDRQFTGTSADDQTGAAKNDVSLVSAEVPLLFEVTDFYKYEQFGAPDQREEMIRAIARREVFTYLATQTVDRVLGRGRADISAELLKRVSRALDEKDAGIRVLFVGIEGVHPPRDTAELFEGVVQSLQQRQGNIENGTREANEKLIRVAGSVEAARRLLAAIDAADAARAAGADPQRQAELEMEAERLLSHAQGEAAVTLHRAKAERWSRHMTARGKAERNPGQLASYRASPAVYTAKLYLQTLADAISRSRVYIIAGDESRTELRLDMQDAAASGNLFDTARKKDE